MSKTDPTSIDREMLRDELRSCELDELATLVERASHLLSDSPLQSWLQDVIPDFSARRGLFVDVQTFFRRSLNDHAQLTKDLATLPPTSPRAREWIVECRELCARTAAASEAGLHEESSASFDLLLEVVRELCLAPFDDSASARATGLDPDQLLPAWFRSLAASSESDRARFAEKGIRLLAPDRAAEFESRAARLGVPLDDLRRASQW